ncbi:C-GCAxxG-C-C family protein [Robertmurraya andreesenii]|uniref:C_GCAxxG_C_C family protein n=1 Tax=Anoxybacillus andreesenii TaxID=1325932 RepID=A0ABT9UYL8_9BACL|nr:C-GCAxxG-C-C family protein [Robertmurraya andreesenii]MDQ0153789.1 hypothetical protein [Robertmurraya andreesenii]
MPENDHIKAQMKDVEKIALSYHQNGLNGAQAVLQALMDSEVIENMPELIKMTSAWKGGIAGGTCSAYAAATLALGLEQNDREKKLKAFDQWFKENFGAISCPAITAQVGGRPSPSQKSFCDKLSAKTAGYIFQLTNSNKQKEK